MTRSGSHPTSSSVPDSPQEHSPARRLIVTCEHGGNTIPARYRKWFVDAEATLSSHRGWDPGALPLAKRLAKSLDAPLFFSQTSRLLIDLNRSLGHPRLFSEFSRKLDVEQRQTIIETMYAPYRASVLEEIEHPLQAGVSVLHVSVHSFTPVLHERTRRTDIGLLFDPSRPTEAAFCRHWRRALRQRVPEFKTHFNLPYRGISDGFPTSLRQHFCDGQYAGIELEVNQKYPLQLPELWSRMQVAILETASEVLAWGDLLADSHC